MARSVTIVKLAWVILLGLGVFAVYSVNAAWDELPQRVASHYDVRGRPDGFMPRDAFFFGLAMFGACTAAFLLAFPALPRIIPLRYLNVPHRDYWLAPERRAQSLASIAAFCSWFGIATATLLVVLLQLTLRANIEGTGLRPAVANGALGLYFVSMAASLVALCRRFRKPTTNVER